MKVKALVSFSGKVSMFPGQIIDLRDKELIDDYSRAGFIEILENQTEKLEKNEEKPAPADKAVIKNESKRNKSK